MKRALLPLILSASLASAVWAQPADDYANAELLTTEELGDIRGGLQTPSGVEFGFGAVVRTYVDGSLALQSRLTWTETGPLQTLEVGMLTPDLAAQAASGGIVLSGAGQLQGLLIPGDGGVTAVTHSITGEHIAQMVINNANNRSIRQSTEITISLPAFAQLQQSVALQTMDLRLGAALGMALRDAATR
ncbi:MAG: hypothetical protein JWM88_1028 [Verrucomicrobia bacterium]|nr:hypothetical protein [Verrucomicrobiota bacterium]